MHLPKLEFRKKRMQARSLTLDNAWQLASILNKYVDIIDLDPQAEPISFISDIVQKLSPEEYLHCVMLLTEENEETINQEISLDVLTAFVEGLKMNQVVTLIHFYKSLVSS